jgi:hypothetical protein
MLLTLRQKIRASVSATVRAGMFIMLIFILPLGCKQSITEMPASGTVIDSISWVDISGDEMEPSTLKVSSTSALPTTIIEFYLPSHSFVTLVILDGSATEVMHLLDHEEMDEGYQDVDFDASNLATGVYIYSLVAEISQDGIPTSSILKMSKKMMLIK